MKNRIVIFLSTAVLVVILSSACNKSESNKKLHGNWRSKDGIIHLKITAKQFTLDQEPEDYFLKGDTIFTSFEGNLPYTKFVIQKLDDKQLNLFFPDSVAVEFTR